MSTHGIEVVLYTLALVHILSPTKILQTIVEQVRITTRQAVNVDTPVVMENFSIEIAMRDVLVKLSPSVSANNSTFGDLPLGSIVDVNNILPCAITIVDNARISELVKAASDVSAPTLNDLNDANRGTRYILSAFAYALFDMSICNYHRKGTFVIQRR
jgi:hypothetical protein